MELRRFGFRPVDDEANDTDDAASIANVAGSKYRSDDFTGIGVECEQRIVKMATVKHTL